MSPLPPDPLIHARSRTPFIGRQRERALLEERRRLALTGQASVVLTAWGPLDTNVCVATMLTPFFKRVELPTPPAGAPQPLRFAGAGSLSTELRIPGFEQVEQEARVITSRWPGPPEEFWQHFYAIAVPFQPVIDGLPSTERDEAISEVIANLSRYYDGERVNIPAAIVVASAIRPR